MKKLLIISFCLLSSISVFAQTPAKVFKQSFSGADKKIIILSGSTNLTIEGVSGTEVILEADKSDADYPEEAEGLRIVSVGAVDNTGMGANIFVEGNIMKIRIPKSKYFGNFTLKIPKELSINVKENGNSYGKWYISGMKGEVEASTSFSTLNISNVSGPIVARGGFGKIYIVYDQLNQSKPNSISASGAVDITLPADTKANLKLKAQFNEVFTDFDIQPAQKTVIKEKNETSVLKPAKALTTYPNSAHADSPEINLAKSVAWADASKSSDCDCTNDGSTIGIINGGGVSLSIKSDHGNIYLRKKK